MFSAEHIPSLLPAGHPLYVCPPHTSSGLDQPAVKEGVPCKQSHPGVVDLSVFDVLNTFHRRWFLSRANLLANAISAQKAEDGNISWVEFTPPFHSHLVKCAVVLVPHPVHMVKQVMFVFILELLNGDGPSAFFNLQKGGRKANNAQKEKRHLARKRSRAAKRERDHEAAKVAKLPMRERQCEACGRKFESRKTARKHKCPVPKVESVREEAAVVSCVPIADFPRVGPFHCRS
jgi:predicted Zn-ribbon and HTH transcriptional regulator